MKLYCTHFNFCREHGGLVYEDERKVKRKNKHTCKRVWNCRVKMGVKRFDDIKISENINHILMDDQRIQSWIFKCKSQF